MKKTTIPTKKKKKKTVININGIFHTEALIGFSVTKGMINRFKHTYPRYLVRGANNNPWREVSPDFLIVSVTNREKPLFGIL